jgi:hypothetical protein
MNGLRHRKIKGSEDAQGSPGNMSGISGSPVKVQEKSRNFRKQNKNNCLEVRTQLGDNRRPRNVSGNPGKQSGGQCLICHLFSGSMKLIFQKKESFFKKKF